MRAFNGPMPPGVAVINDFALGDSGADGPARTPGIFGTEGPSGGASALERARIRLAPAFPSQVGAPR